MTFCPPALAIQNMSPDAPTSPPGGASGLNIFGAIPIHSRLPAAARAPFITPVEPASGPRIEAATRTSNLIVARVA